MTIDKYPDVLSVPNVCDILHVSRGTVYKMIRGEGDVRLPSRKIAGHYKILKRDVLALFNDER